MLLLSNNIQAGDNPYFKHMVYQKYVTELQLNKAYNLIVKSLFYLDFYIVTKRYASII